MIRINEENKILLEYRQHATTKNKKYNYKEVTIPSDIYHYWTQRNDNQPVNEVTIFTIMHYDKRITYITPSPLTPEDVKTPSHITTLRIRINKSRPTKNGKQKQKATMTINKNVRVLCDDIIFIFDLNSNDINTNVPGVCSVEGLEVLSLNARKEKKVGKEKKPN